MEGELLFPRAGADPRLCCDHAAPAGRGARPLELGAHFRLRRDYAAPEVSAAVPLGVGANSRFRRDFAAPAGCAASLFGVGGHHRLRRALLQLLLGSYHVVHMRMGKAQLSGQEPASGVGHFGELGASSGLLRASALLMMLMVC